ncbi:MAG: DEAD/DEAH box helicase [Spirochaetales bacterium]|nr:DEAD/DEAH box helicase [Spirochaetales bacterium]
MKFEKLALLPEILQAVKEKGYTHTTPIQTRAIPAVLAGKDILGGAQTGTGKTAAFALPILNLLETSAGTGASPRALVLAPTRELADQVGESFKTYGAHLDLVTLKVYGGAKMSAQTSNLEKGSDIVIATPGRLMDHIRQDSIDLSRLQICVLDEADRMLDMGFINDIRAIMGMIKQKTQNLLFSATYGPDIEKLARQILKDPVAVEVSKRNAAASDIKQKIHYVDKGKRFDLLLHLIQEGQWYQVLIFVKTKHTADRVAADLLKAKIPAAALHGDKSQGARNRALKNFKSGDLQALVATDVAARGIDLHDMSHVVNFELPQIPEDYIHRIGRTGRAGKSGTAISLISFSEKNQLLKIEKLLKSKIPVEPVAGFEPKHDVDKVLKKKTSSPSARGGKPAGRGSRNTAGSSSSDRSSSGRSSTPGGKAAASRKKPAAGKQGSGKTGPGKSGTGTSRSGSRQAASRRKSPAGRRR